DNGACWRDGKRRLAKPRELFVINLLNPTRQRNDRGARVDVCYALGDAVYFIAPDVFSVDLLGGDDWPGHFVRVNQYKSTDARAGQLFDEANCAASTNTNNRASGKMNQVIGIKHSAERFYVLLFC